MPLLSCISHYVASMRCVIVFYTVLFYCRGHAYVAYVAFVTQTNKKPTIEKKIGRLFTITACVNDLPRLVFLVW